MSEDQELDELRAELQRTAPPGFHVADVWRCRTCCEDVHALVLADGDRLARPQRRGAARGRAGGGRRRA